MRGRDKTCSSRPYDEKKIIFFLGLQNKVGATDQPRSIPLWLRRLHGGIPLGDEPCQQVVNENSIKTQNAKDETVKISKYSLDRQILTQIFPSQKIQKLFKYVTWSTLLKSISHINELSLSKLMQGHNSQI